MAVNTVEAPPVYWDQFGSDYAVPSHETMQSPIYQKLAYQTPQFSRRIGHLAYNNPSGWMTFLAAYRKRHPKPRTLREGADLVKAAGIEYRKLRKNPSKDHVQNMFIAGGVLLAMSFFMGRR